MNDNVLAYFQTSKDLANKLSEVNRLRQHGLLSHEVRLLDMQIAHATRRVDELVEIFTWETQDTDLIRSAFLEIAKNTLKNLRKLPEYDMDAAAISATPTLGLLLIENTSNALRKALISKGRYVPSVELPQGLASWCYQLVENFLQTLFRQLQQATFDNLLEAVTYFEKSTLLLKLQYETQEKTKRF